MSTTPVVAVSREGHSSLDALNDDAIPQCRSVSPNCSTSPIPRYERNMGFFRQLSRRFGLRSNDDLVFTNSNEDDNQSSSTDSCSSHTSAATAASIAANNNKKENNLLHTTVQGNEYVSCASSETSSTVDIEEQLQQMHKQQQQQQQLIGNVSSDDDDGDNANDNNENSNDAVVRPAYNKERKSFARSSLSHIHRRSTNSLRRAFGAFSLSSRSLSCSGVPVPSILPTSSSSISTNNGTPVKSSLKSSSNLEINKKLQSSSVTTSFCTKKTSTSSSSAAAPCSKTKAKVPPKRILRQPVSYTYLKGISGLPTQRVPRNSVCCQYARH